MGSDRTGWVRVALAVCVLAAAACAPKPRQLSGEELYQRFIGTWVNTEYPGTTDWPQVMVVLPDHVEERWAFPDSGRPVCRSTNRIKATWVDEQGRACCQMYRTFEYPVPACGNGAAVLMRLDRAGRVCEINSRTGSESDTSLYLRQIEPELQGYWVYYRNRRN